MICCKCKNDLEVTLFYKDKHKPSGYKPRCKKCDKLSIDKKRRATYESNYYSDPEKRNKKRAVVRASCEKNKEAYAKKRREYLKTDKGISMHRKQTQKRYALKKLAFVEDVSPIDLFNEQCGICYICKGKFTFKQMELDHIVPLSKNGKHEIKNCKMACVKCNRSKGAKSLSEVIYQMV